MNKAAVGLGGAITAIAAISASGAAAETSAPPEARQHPAPITRPVLATAQQIETEKTLIRLLGEPQIAAVRRSMAAELEKTPTGRTADGGAMLDRAVWQWTSSFIAGELTARQPEPAFFWWEDAPHTLGGHTVWGTGIGSDLPDNIYRRVTLDGGGAYEISGRIDMSNRPSMMIFEVMRGRIGPIAINEQIKKADMGNHVSSITDDRMKIAPDGSFRITLGGAAGEADHLDSAPGDVTVMVRETLTDWNQRPAELRIHRIAGEPPAALPYDRLVAQIVKGLPAYVRFWSNWHNINMGGFEPNSYKAPVARAGGFGYAGKLRFQLGADEAILLTIASQGARYFSVHVSDPWEITADSRRYQVSLNPSQSRSNDDGTYTYLIGPTDPGVANWIDSAGLHDGYAILRWQGVPKDFAADTAVRDFRVVKLSDVATMPGLVHVSPLQRRLDQAANFAAYERRASD